MKKILHPWSLVVAGFVSVLLLLSGCFETKQDFTLNPDGSGKVVHESTFQIVDFSGSKGNSDEQLKKAAAEVIEKAKGVDAWRDVSFKLLDDGRVYFKGTAYFKNLSELDFPNQTMLDFNWSTAGDGTGLLTMRQKKNDKAGAKDAAKADWSKLSAEERAKKMREERAKFQQMKPMMAGILGTMKHEVVFHLPGKPGEISNFFPDPSGGLHLQFDGAKMLAAMETLMNDDAWMAKNSGSLGGQEMPALDEQVSQLIFGGKGPIQAKVSGLKEAGFDYQGEVAAARQDFPAVQQQLSTPATPVIAPAQGGEVKGVKVVGARLVSDVDEKLDVRPFSSTAGYTLALLVQLPGSVLGMTDECGLDVALADDGSDLLPESDFSRKISFPKLSADKAAVMIEVEMKPPGAGVKGLKELSGHLQYTVAGGTKEIDLGFTKLTINAKGKELAAEIESIKPGDDNDGSQTLTLVLQTNPENLKALTLVVGNSKTELKQNGYNGGGDSFTYTYVSEKEIPVKGRLVAEVYDQLQNINVPFKLENITLLGDPVETKAP